MIYSKRQTAGSLDVFKVANLFWRILFCQDSSLVNAYIGAETIRISKHGLKVKFGISSIRDFRAGKYPLLVYAKIVDSIESARWLATQTPDILCYSPPSNSRGICSRKCHSVIFAGINELKLFFLYIIPLS